MAEQVDMDLEFKNKLLALYPFYNRVTGPYLRADGRKHITFNNTALSKDDKNKTRSLSWPKALLEVKHGRLLAENETADHIDEDFTNDNMNNLQILTRIDNAVKSFNVNPERHAEYKKFICPECDKEFLKLMRDFRGNQLVQGKTGPFCTRICAGKNNQKRGRLAQLAEAKCLNHLK